MRMVGRQGRRVAVCATHRRRQFELNCSARQPDEPPILQTALRFIIGIMTRVVGSGVSSGRHASADRHTLWHFGHSLTVGSLSQLTF